jgi:hypothetical protein
MKIKVNLLAEEFEHTYKEAYQAGAEASKEGILSFIKERLKLELENSDITFHSYPKLSDWFFTRHHGIYDLLEHLEERMKNEVCQ